MLQASPYTFSMRSLLVRKLAGCVCEGRGRGELTRGEEDSKDSLTKGTQLVLHYDMSSATDRGYGVGLSPSAWEKRNKQLENWKASETNREPSYPIPRRTTKSRVHFSKDVMFLAAVNAGDEQEVERLLSDEKADVNCRNNDGLTAVHQVQERERKKHLFSMPSLSSFSSMVWEFNSWSNVL